MKKITTIILIMLTAMFTITAYAYNFPEPDWGALLSERRSMVTAADFELYVESQPENTKHYNGKFEPNAGVYIGMTADTANNFLPLGSYLTYIESFDQQDLYYPSNEMILNNDVITMVGWTVNSLDDVNYDSVRRILAQLNSYNKPMFVRFANEMNVSAIGNDPDRYVQIFRTVADMVHEYPNLAVVWSPNDIGALDRPFGYYYPGDEYVDWVGVSCYMTKYFNSNPNTTENDSIYFMTGDYSWATNQLKPIIEFMKDNNINKPVMISEGGVARSNNFGDEYTSWHGPRLRNMLWNVIMKYPQVKMINYFNINHDYDTEKFQITDYPESVEIFKAAANNGAYLTSASDTPDFVFSPANDGGTLIADKDGIVNLYTLAYIAGQPDISVNYRIDGQWSHSSNQIPYTYKFNINKISDGIHTLSIDSYGMNKEYTLYKRGQYISFGKEPDTSLPNPNAQPDISVLLNGNSLSFEQPPVIIGGRTLVPLRAIFEAMNATVDWNQNTQTVTSTRGNITIKLTIGENTLYKNGQPVTLDVPAQLISDYTMIPVRAVAEAFGADVKWDGDSRIVTIAE